MNKILSPAPLWQNEGVGFARMITGIFLIYHGWEIFDEKQMQDYAQWDLFKNNAYASFMVYCGKGTEFITGILLALGLFTRITCIIIACTFLYISFFVGNGKIWYEDQYPFLFVILALLFFFTGPGKWALDNIVFKKQ
ncbi:MAG: DoxX family protein [Ginsengibacter sp.]